jgi:hypothetical protein
MNDYYMNLLIIGYCRLEDGFLYASKALERLNYTIFFFPYHNYTLDNIENKDNILEEYIIDNQIKICLWWNNNINSNTIRNIIYNMNNKKNLNIKNYLFNWDPLLYNYKKYDLNLWEDRIDGRKNTYILLNHVLSCFEKEINYFKNQVKISYAGPGFNKEISYYEKNQDYECDVSIVLTNLYRNNKEFPENLTNITRYEIVDKLYENRDKIKFHIYGYENLKELYPECYKGFIKYNECRKVFSNSKINLSIHPIVNELNKPYSNYEYYSERVPQILGCKGLLITNSYLSKYLKDGIDYIYIDRYMDWYECLMDIINNNQKYEIIRENGYQKGLLYYQWNNWAQIFNDIVHND